MPKRWLVSLSEKVDAAVPFTDKPPRFGMPSATTEELQRRCSQKAGKNCTPILVTAEGVCVAGAVGLPEGMSCVCDLLKAKGHTPVHRSLPPHPGSSLVIATVRAALGLPQRKTVASPLVPAGGLPTWTAAVPKSVATCQPTFVEDVKRTIDAVRKRAGALEEYLGTIQGSFANVFEGWLSDADSTGPRATDEHASNAPFWSFRALLNLANQLYAKPYVPSLKLSDSEAKAVKRVLAEWPCELHFQSALSKDGMFVPKQHQKGGCRNQSCCFAHHNVLAEDGSLKCSSFGITVNGIAQLRFHLCLVGCAERVLEELYGSSSEDLLRRCYLLDRVLLCCSHLGKCLAWRLRDDRPAFCRLDNERRVHFLACAWALVPDAHLVGLIPHRQFD